MQDKKIICITPVRNESHNIERFLKATSLWADTIILADQKSTDDTASIAKRYPKAVIIENNSDYNEFERTKLLMHEARKIEGPKIILALDADEIFSANFLTSPEWQTLINSQVGTVFLFDRVNLSPEYDMYFDPLKMVFGFVDDGETSIENTSQAIIHNIRIPWPKNAQTIYFRDIKVLHLSHIDYGNTISALRWYQCFEKVKFNYSDRKLREKYFVQYNLNDFLSFKKLHRTKQEWLDNYKQKDIDVSSVKSPIFWREHDLLAMFQKHGLNTFKGLDIYGIDWVAMAKKYDFEHPEFFKINRSWLDKIKFRINTHLIRKRFSI